MNEITEWAWAAAIMDGEGSFYIAKTKTGYVVTISVEMTHEETIRKLKRIFRTGIFTPKISRTERHKDTFSLVVTGKEVFDIVRGLALYLVTKREQADLILEYEEKCYTDRGTYGIGRGKAPIELVALREIIREELQELNKRGKS